MGFRNVVNDGSSNQPRLRFQRRSSAPLAFAGGDAGAIAQFLDQIAGEGFSGFEATCPSEQEADELATMLRDRGLAIGFATAAGEVDDLLNPLELAHRMRADYLSVRVTGSLKAAPEIAKILEEMYDLVNDAGLPLFIETRSGSVTQDLRRTVKFIRRFKKVRFTGDFSDYIAASALGAEWPEDVSDHFREIARRCGNWHGRLGSGKTAPQIKKLWTLGMAAWLNKARPGDVLPFCCDLGAGDWEQIKRLAEEAWAEALAGLKQPEENPTPPTEVAADQGIH